MGSWGREAAFGEARAEGAPRVDLTADPRAGKGRRQLAWLRREGAFAAPPIPTCAPYIPCGVAGPPVGVPWPPPRQRGGEGIWSVIGPAGGGWPGETAGGWTASLQVGMCAPGGYAGAWYCRVSGGGIRALLGRL